MVVPFQLAFITEAPFCLSFSSVRFIHEPGGQKNLLDGVQRAFQHTGIDGGKFLANISQNGVDNGIPGSTPFPSERGHFCADSPSVGWIISPFYQTVRLEAVHQLGNVRPHTGKLLGQVAKAYRSVLLHQDRQRLKFRVG